MYDMKPVQCEFLDKSKNSSKRVWTFEIETIPLKQPRGAASEFCRADFFMSF